MLITFLRYLVLAAMLIVVWLILWLILEFWALLVLLIVVWLILELWALVDLARTNRDTGYKLIWALIIFSSGAFGAILYYFLEVGRR